MGFVSEKKNMFAVLPLSSTSLTGVQLANRLVAERGRCYKPSRLSELAPSRTRQNTFVLTLNYGRGLLSNISYFSSHVSFYKWILITLQLEKNRPSWVLTKDLCHMGARVPLCLVPCFHVHQIPKNDLMIICRRKNSLVFQCESCH